MDYMLGEIRCFPSEKIPWGWLECQGQVLQISAHAALWTILGKQFGGDGEKTFALPDLRGRVPRMPAPTGLPQGTQGGQEVVELTAEHLPSHTHMARVSTEVATQAGVKDTVPALAPGANKFYSKSSDKSRQVQLQEETIALAGAGQPVPNMQPYLALVFCIATEGGLFPSQR